MNKKNLYKKIELSNEQEYLGENKSVNLTKPLVSVIVVTYQHAKLINDCIEGILIQKTSFPIEVIIGEDESKDGTRDICMKYAENNQDKIRLFLRSRKDVIYVDQSPTGSFNYLANLAAVRGRYVAVCDGDDYWTDPYKLQKQFDYMENNNDCTLCMHAAAVTDINNIRRYEVRPRIGNEILKIEELIPGEGVVHTASCSMFFLSGIVKTLPDWFFSSPVSDLAVRLLAAEKGRVYYIDEYMCVYRRGADSSVNRLMRKNKNRAAIFFRFIEMLNEFNSQTNNNYDKLVYKSNLGFFIRAMKWYDMESIKHTKHYKDFIKHLSAWQIFYLHANLQFPYFFFFKSKIKKAFRKYSKKIAIKLLKYAYQI